MNESQINKILFDLESGYDQMADKFSETRKFFWCDLEFIADHIKNGDKILDYGCGNGRLLEILKDKNIDYTGADVSEKLINLAKLRYPEGCFIKITSQYSLPFPDDSFNEVVSVAVFHHFPKEHAEKIAREIFRITGTGGRVIATVWNLWQKKFQRYRWSPAIIKSKILGVGRYGGLGFRDLYIPFKNNTGEAFYRYHRAYTSRELTKIFSSAGFIVERCEIINEKNIVLVARKADN